jgi:hypothetical protein
MPVCSSRNCMSRSLLHKRLFSPDRPLCRRTRLPQACQDRLRSAERRLFLCSILASLNGYSYNTRHDSAPRSLRSRQTIFLNNVRVVLHACGVFH